MRLYTRRETRSLLKSYSKNNYIVTQTNTRKEWLAARRGFVGASDCAAVLGKSPWSTAKDLYYDKINDESKKRTHAENESMMKGTMSESRIRELFLIETGLRVLDGTGFILEGASPGTINMSCSLDGIILPDSSLYKPRVLEIKSVSNMDGWTEDSIPEHYLIQMVHQLLVTGWDSGIMLVRFRATPDLKWGGRERIYEVFAEDHRKLMDTIMLKVSEFWKCVKSRTVPAVSLPEV